MMSRDMVEQVAARLDMAAARLLRQTRRSESGGGLSPARLGALASVAKAGRPLSLAELAAAEQVTAPTMSRIVDSLVREGLLAREQDPQNRRTVRITATGQGQQLLDEGRKASARALVQRLNALGDSEKRALLRGVELMEQITRN
jgi:DNA-binding MarR family transcriptional regulator